MDLISTVDLSVDESSGGNLPKIFLKIKIYFSLQQKIQNYFSWLNKKTLFLNSLEWPDSIHIPPNLNLVFLFQSRTEGYFGFRELDRQRVAIVLEKSLQDLVDTSTPMSTIQFRMACKSRFGGTDYMPVSWETSVSLAVMKMALLFLIAQ